MAKIANCTQVEKHAWYVAHFIKEKKSRSPEHASAQSLESSLHPQKKIPRFLQGENDFSSLSRG